MMTTKDLREWLSAALPARRFYSGPDLPNYPKTHAVLTPFQSGGMTMEQAFDQLVWQVHVVGPQSRNAQTNEALDQCETFMRDVDKTIITACYDGGIQIGDSRVIRTQPYGGRPSTLPTDSGGRVHLVASYSFECSTGY